MSMASLFCNRYLMSDAIFHGQEHIAWVQFTVTDFNIKRKAVRKPPLMLTSFLQIFDLAIHTMQNNINNVQ